MFRKLQQDFWEQWVAKMKNYYLRSGQIGVKHLEISEADFLRYKHAAEALKLVDQIESTFSLFANAVMEIEKFLMNVCIEHGFDGDNTTDHMYFSKIRDGLNLKVFSMLAAARAHEEQVYQRLGEIYAVQSAEVEAVRNMYREVYDTIFEYRFMTRLRNYAMHDRLPLGGINFTRTDQEDHEVDNSRAKSRQRLTINPYFMREELLRSNKLKSKLRQEIKEMDVIAFDLKHCVRSFASAVALCQEKVRGISFDAAEDAMDCIRSANERYQMETGRTAAAVFAAQTDDDLRAGEEIFIAQSHFETVIKKRERWKNFTSIYKTFISSEVIDKKHLYPGGVAPYWTPK